MYSIEFMFLIMSSSDLNPLLKCLVWFDPTVPVIETCQSRVCGKKSGLDTIGLDRRQSSRGRTAPDISLSSYILQPK